MNGKWIGEYSLNHDKLSGKMKVSVSGAFQFGDISATTDKGKMCARLFIWEMDDGTAALTLHSYCEDSENRNYHVSDPVFWLKEEDGVIYSRLQEAPSEKWERFVNRI